MTTTLQKWGNSLALRIPKAYADEIEVKEGHAVDVRVAKGRIVIEARHARPQRLEDLIAGMTRKNLHQEADIGGKQGREAW